MKVLINKIMYMYNLFKIILAVTSIPLLLLTSCSRGCNTVDLQSTVDSLTNVVASQQAQIKSMRDSISILQFPADQRLAMIKRLIADESFIEAKKEIAALQSYFPNSQEATQCPSLIESINSKVAAIEAEKERIKALGFKALKTQTKVTVGYNTVVFGSFSIGAKFIHDVYPTYTGSSWYEHTADRGNKYISCAMDVTSSSKGPDIPTLAFYAIQGDKLVKKGDLWVQMGRWQDYGTYLGNEHDLKNDFSKVSTVKFKLGLELPDADFSAPYVIVLKKANTQVRHYERMRNPPVYYEGNAGYPQTLNIDNFSNGDYVAIKIANL